jgi:signal peptidase
MSKADNKKSNRVSRSSIAMVFYMLIIVLLAGFITKFISTNDYSLFGYTLRIVVSGSMEPQIKTNSLTVIKNCDISEVEVGDIICFSYYQDIVHRVIEKDYDESGNIILHTKGDANNTADNVEVNSDMLVGKVDKIYNNVAGFIDKYSISPGEIDSAALSRTIVIGCLVIGLLVAFLYWIIECIINVIISLRIKNFDRNIDKYLADIDELAMYREILNDIRDGYRKGDMYNLISRVQAEMAVRELHSNIKAFKRSMNRALYFDKLGSEMYEKSLQDKEHNHKSRNKSNNDKDKD